jgi:hypothetical protein
MQKRTFLAAAVLLATIGSVAAASTTTIFVTKSAVQTALGVNNAWIQANHANLVWTVQETVSYTIDCVKTVGSGVTMENDFRRESAIGASTAFGVGRQTGQVTGFHVTIEEANGGDVDYTCPGGWTVDGDGNVRNISATSGLAVDGVQLPDYAF